MEEDGLSSNELEKFKTEYLRVLEHYLPPELTSQKDVTAISVGCGFAQEAEVFTKIIPNIYYEGIDIVEDLIDGARSYNSNIPSDQFRVADASTLEVFGQTPWDLVILRNPQLLNPVTVSLWLKTLDNSFKALRKGGFLYLTTIESIEMDRTMDFYRKIGGFTEIVAPQIISVTMEAQFPLKEKYIAILKKE